MIELRVVVVTTSFPLTDESPSGTFVLQLVRHLPEGARVDVVTPCAREAVQQPFSGRYRVSCFRYAPRRWRTLAHGPGGLPAALRRGLGAWVLFGLLVPAMLIACLRAARSADLIHANWSVSGLIAGIAGLLTSTPVVTTLRGTDVSASERSALFRVLLKSCHRLSRRLVTVGYGIQERAARVLGVDPSAIEVIPNGVDELFFSVPPPSEQDVLRILTVGSLVEVKRMDIILRALARLPAATRWEWTLVGEGPERDLLESLAKQFGLSEQVHIVGAVPPTEIPEILARHHVFVLASRSEGRPNALIEALAAGRAVVASGIPEIAELVSDRQTGLLFSQGDIQELADHLYRLYEDPALVRRLGNTGRASVKGLSWESTGRRYGLLYEQVVRSTRAGCAV